MNPRQLEAFLATVRAGSITAAARSLGIAQPSVSRLVADLESSVGFRLFVRSGRGLVPTAEARRFYRAVESLYVGMDRLGDTARAIRQSGEDVLSLGMIAVFAHSELMGAVRDVYRHRPALRISVSVRTNQDIIGAVRMQHLDIGLVSSLHSIEGLRVIAEAAVPHVCLLPESHPLARDSGPMRLSELIGEPFVSLPTDYLAVAHADRELLVALHDRARLTSHSMPAVATLARVTGALALVDRFSASVACAQGGVVMREVVERPHLPVAVVSHGDDTLTEAGHDLARRLGERLLAV